MADSDIHKKLYWASSAGSDARVRELLAAGAEPDKYKDSDGNTALAKAALWCYDSTVSILIQHRADINIQNADGETALYKAAFSGHNNVAATLIKAEADINIQNKYGETALHEAAEKGHNNVAATLIKGGADLNIRNKNGETALEKAATNGHFDVASILMEAGAKVPPGLASRMLNKEPSRISSVLDFLSKKLDNFENTDGGKMIIRKQKKNLELESRRRCSTI